MTLFTINPSNAALSAQTVKVIQGSAPYLLLSDGTKLKNLDSLLGFSMPKRDGSKGREQIDSTSTELVLSKTMKFSDIEATGYTVYHQHDDDGDATIPSQAISITWLNNRNETISDLNQFLSLCDAPYTLTISVNNLTARTAYGIPRQSDNYGSIRKTYLFDFIEIKSSANQKITHIQPQSMNVYTVNTIYPQGYNPAVWDVGKGFSVEKLKAAGKHFPTTGFDKAVFDLVGTGSDQTRYCSKAPANYSWVKVSGRRVTYQHDSKQGKPKTPVKLDMYYLNDSNSWAKIDSYTIPVPSKWAISPVGESYQVRYGNADYLSDVTQFDALDACRKVGPRADNQTTGIAEGRGQTAKNRADRQRFMYRRDELTNSKLADRTQYPEGASVRGYSYYSRDIGTFMGEWGYVYDYAQSPWSANVWYWAAEAYNANSQSSVNASGDVFWSSLSNRGDHVAICRGE